jgi:hypothetical protein
MAFYEEAWFHHALNETVYKLAEQTPTKMYSAVTVREGVVGKTYPFDILGGIEMAPVTQQFMGPGFMPMAMTKRRVALKDFFVRVGVDDFDQLKMLPNLQSEKAQRLAAARNRQLDVLINAAVLGNATTVDESGETTGTQALPSAQLDTSAGAFTLKKVMDAKIGFDEDNIDEEGRYMFVSPKSMGQLIDQTKVGSSDYNTLRALQSGGFRSDEMYHGFIWRTSNLLTKVANIRYNVAWQKRAVGLAVAKNGGVTVKDRPDLINVTQVELTISANAIRIEDKAVRRIDGDESVAIVG